MSEIHLTKFSHLDGAHISGTVTYIIFSNRKSDINMISKNKNTAVFILLF